ncbi:hypothetical protein [Microbacterium hydrothermale]|nr:hypothetical protein [Microbacterium hydrothermale]
MLSTHLDLGLCVLTSWQTTGFLISPVRTTISDFPQVGVGARLHTAVCW